MNTYTQDFSPAALTTVTMTASHIAPTPAVTERTTRFIVGLFAVALITATSVGCNTVRGFGRDVEKTGDHIQAGTH